MSDQYYNKDTVNEMIKSIHDTMIRVEQQVLKTNGRVTALEKWKWTIVGGAAVLGALNVPNIALIAKMFAGTP